MATKKSKEDYQKEWRDMMIEKVKDEVAYQLISKEVTYAYLKHQLDNETDEDRKKQVQVAVDKAETDVSHVTKLHEFVNEKY